MEKLKIQSMLDDYAKRKADRYHMPGHKADKQFSKIFSCAAQDITELAFSDSLSCPTGIIREAEDRVSEILGAKKAYFITDGSSCGVFSMLYAVREKGNKIIVNRNAHQCVFNACRLFGIEPIVLGQNVKNGIMLPPSVDEMERALEENDSCIGMLLTYPDYYGLTFDIKKARELCDKYGKYLLIDGAHGAHLRFVAMPEYHGQYADIWVDGVHKTLPCLTQAAVLAVGNKTLTAKVSGSVNLFRTTSPSYPIMSSIEYGEEFMEANGRDLLSKLRVETLALKSRLNAKGLKTLSEGDSLKLAVDFKSVGISPYKAEKYLNGKKIYAEMNDGRYLLFILGINTGKFQMLKLEYMLLKLLKKRDLRGTYEERIPAKTGVRVMPYLKAAKESRKESVLLSESAGKIVAENVGVFPPCFPLCMAGEVMTEDIIAVLAAAKHTFGINNNKIKVVK